MQKTGFGPEKCASEILVYGFIVARVNRETEPEVAVPDGATQSDAATWPEFLKKKQSDTRIRRRLTRPQGAFG
jgi:hypothetical protein